MMNQLTPHSNNQNKQFKPNIYQGKRRGQLGNYYDQGIYENRYRLNSGNRRSFRGKGQYRQSYRERPRYFNTYGNDHRRDNYREMQNYGCQNFKGGYRNNNN